MTKGDRARDRQQDRSYCKQTHQAPASVASNAEHTHGCDCGVQHKLWQEIQWHEEHAIQDRPSNV
ncbi:hypothetical protein ACO1K6_13465, partial [Staphylococcus aureus]